MEKNDLFDLCSEKKEPLVLKPTAHHCGARFDRDWINECIATRFSEVLTTREREVCSYILLDHSSESIAKRLGISPNTVLTHRRKVYRKLNVATQCQLFSLLVDGMLLPVI